MWGPEFVPPKTGWIQEMPNIWPFKKHTRARSDAKCSIWVCLKMVRCTPLYPMVLLIIIPMKNGYFIGNIPYFQTGLADHYPYEKWLFHWEYIPNIFRSKPMLLRFLAQCWTRSWRCQRACWCRSCRIPVPGPSEDRKLDLGSFRWPWKWEKYEVPTISKPSIVFLGSLFSDIPICSGRYWEIREESKPSQNHGEVLFHWPLLRLRRSASEWLNGGHQCGSLEIDESRSG